MKEFKKIIICGSYGAGNLGDEMILEGILTIIRHDYPKAEVFVMSGNLSDTETRHKKFKISAIPMIPSGFKSTFKSWFSKTKDSKILKTSQIIKESDLFILGGGGLFSNLTLRSNWIWYRQVLPAIKNKISKIDLKSEQKNKVPQIWCLGQSIDSFTSNFLKNFIRKIILKKIFPYFDKITVRDSKSKEVLENLNLKTISQKKLKIKIQPDFATHINLGFLKKLQKSSNLNKKTIIVSLRKLPKDQSKLITETTTYLENLILNQNYQVKFINFDTNKNSDHLLHGKIIKNLKSNPKIQKYKQTKKSQPTKIIEYIKTPKNSQEILTHFHQADQVLGMRLHSIITALITKTPFKAISYNEKIRNYLKTHYNQTST